MGILDSLKQITGSFGVAGGGLRHPDYGPPDVSHIEARAANIDLFDTATYTLARSFGITDATMPALSQMRAANRGLFSRCLSLRADAIARAIAGGRGHGGFAVQRPTAQGEYEDVEMRHPWVQLLRRPNPNRSALEVWRWASLCRDLRGSADFIVEDDRRGVPVAMYEIFPEFGEVRPVPDARGGVAGYIFLRSDGERIELEARDVIRFRHPDPITPYENMSLLEKGAYELDKVLYSDIYERDTLRDGRFPPVVLSSDQQLGEEQAKRYGKMFKDAYMATGHHTVKGVPVMGAGLKPVPTTLKAADIALIDSRRLTDTHLFWITGVPQGLLSDDANRANAEASQFFFAAYTVQPEADQLAAQMTHGFERSFRAQPGALVVQAPDVVPVDPEQRARIDDLRLKNGTLTVNEARRRDGQDEVEGGNEAMVSGILVPLRQAARGGRETISQPAAKAGGDDESDDDDHARAGGLLQAIGRERARGLRADEDTLKKEWQAVERRKRRAERPIEAAMLAWYDAIRADVVRRIRELSQRGLRLPNDRTISADSAHSRAGGEAVLTVDMVFDLARWTTVLEDELPAHVLGAIRMGFETGMLRVSADGTFNAGDERVRDVLRQVITSSRSIPETLRDEIADAIRDGLMGRESWDEMTARLTRLLDDMAPWKARQIAVTSATPAFERGQLIAFQDAGITRRRWLSQRDGRVRHSHMAVDGQERSTSEPFEVGGYQMMHPGDSSLGAPAKEIVNCRCTALPILLEDD